MSLQHKLCFVVSLLGIGQLVRTDQCPAPKPCSCSGRDINCKNKNLTSVPQLIGSRNTSYNLDLRHNVNLFIKDDSFANISLEQLQLDCSRNLSISDHAFKHQENTLKHLNISTAQLDTIPQALNDLNKLRHLYVANNKIRHWNTGVMQKLGFSLTKIDISENRITSWPNFLKYLSNLQWLSVKGNRFGKIPHNAFNRFHLNLKYLDIQNTGIKEIPVDLQTLDKLTELHIGGLTLNDSSFYETWLLPETCESKLKKLYISNTQITEIPLGLRGNDVITTLEILGSRIKNVDESTLPVNLTRLQIHDSMLTRVNAGICSHNLTWLSLRKNKIECIEKNDLHDCTHLGYLSLSDNSIAYISPAAFVRLPHLNTLYLTNNRFYHIPTAIQTLDSLDRLSLSGNALECTCQDDWFPRWRKNHTPLTYLSGTCTHMGIHLDNFLLQC